MLTTIDLYEKAGYRFGVGDRVRFKLLRGFELIRNYEFGSGIVARSRNHNLNRAVTGTVADYRPGKLGDLEISGVMDDGYAFILRLNQCRDLRVLE